MFLGDEAKEPLKAILKKRLVQIFRAPAQEQVNLDAMSFSEPRRRLVRLQFQVVFAGADGDLNTLGLRLVCLHAGLTEAFLFLVLVLPVVHDFDHGRHRCWGDLNEVGPRFLRLLLCFGEGKNSEHGTVLCDDPNFGRSNGGVNANAFAVSQAGANEV